MIRNRLLIIGWLLAVVLPSQLDARGSGEAVWQVTGKHNTVFLLGSIHLLRASDYPLPKAMIYAYDEAEALVMEIDMDDLDPMLMAGQMSSIGLISDGRSLRDYMGSRRYDEANKAANKLGYDLDLFAGAKPWFAAMTMVQLHLMQSGFDPSHGIEFYFVGKAGQDGKPITGLETLTQQLEVFNGLSESEQSLFLIKSLQDMSEIDEQINKLITAWKNGDSKALEKEMLAGFVDQPALYRRLVTDRNRNWVQDIEKMLAGKDDFLVIVGAAHLVGRDGVVELLRSRGYRVEQF